MDKRMADLMGERATPDREEIGEDEYKLSPAQRWRMEAEFDKLFGKPPKADDNEM